MTNTDTVFIGQKGLGVYIGGSLNILQRGGKVTIAARGSLISKAILVAYRVAMNADVNLDSTVKVERLKSNDGKDRDVPIIELSLTLKEANPPPAMTGLAMA